MGPGSFAVRFRGEGAWELHPFGEPTLFFDASVGPQTMPGLDQWKLSRELIKVFPALSSVQVNRLCELAANAALQTNGANVLISADAAAEAERLSPQCTAIQPVPVAPADMERLTSIDGTVIIDVHGICHAIGAILDGAVSPRGDRTRGGRYNSAVMYLDSTHVPGLIVVISRDATVDIVSSGHC
jgi:hypothetical protein